MANNTPDLPKIVTSSDEQTNANTQGTSTQAPDASSSNNLASARTNSPNPPRTPITPVESNGSQGPRGRGESISARFSERVKAMRSGGSGGGAGLDRTTSNFARPVRRPTDLTESIVDQQEGSSSAFQGGRSNTVSAGQLRRAETRAREEDWAKTVALPPVIPENGGDNLMELPTFRRSETNNIGSLRRRPTGATTRARGVSNASHNSIALIQSNAPGAAGPDPNFTLAGPAENLGGNLPFVERGYAVLNPAYDQPQNARPVWGLAKPLPRVVRPGMVPSLSELNVNQQQPPDLEAGQAPKKASRAWDLALAAARANKLRRQSQSVAEEELGVPTRIESNAGRKQSTEHPPPIPEDSREGSIEEGMEPFPEIGGGSSQTDFQAGDEFIEEAPLYGEEIHNHHTEWAVIRSSYREPLAELLAVVVQLTLGFCSDLSVTVSNETGPTTAWAWGLSTMVAIYIAGGISGAHLNPAISITLWIYRGFPLRKVPGYIFVQILGGFIAALIAFGVYHNDIIAFGGAHLASSNTASDFVTSRRYTWVNIPTAFFNEFVATAILAIAVLATGDDSNAPPGAGMNAFIIGLIVTVITMAFGHNTGAACNPSRDFGPRLALLALGYGGHELFSDPYWFYGPWVATITGAVFGAGMYDFLIFTGGESPVNYPSYKMKRAARKWRGRMDRRVRAVPGRLRGFAGRRRARGGGRWGYEETGGGVGEKVVN